MIQIENLHFHYKKNKPLFHGLDLHLEAGKIYGLLGKNGTGKSTLLKLLVGALFPKTGQVMLDDLPIQERKTLLLQDIFFLIEDYELPAISIRSYLKANAPFYPKFDEKRFWSLLDIFEIDNQSKLTGLSYGQKKKVLISFAMSAGCKYLFMDEPTNGLDIPSKSQFRKAMLSGFQDHQIVIISTHQIRDLNQLLENVIIIDSGKILFNEDVTEVEDKLAVARSHTEDAVDTSFYSERVAGGYINLVPNTSGEPDEIDLEILFNAVIHNQQALTEHFSKS